MRVPAATTPPLGSHFDQLWSIAWGKSTDVLFTRTSVAISSEGETNQENAECLIFGGTEGPIGDFLADFCGVRGILVRAEYVEALRCIVQRATGYSGSQETITSDILPVGIVNPFVDEIYSPEGYRGVSVIGPTGYGKSLFLLIILVLRLSTERATIYHTEDGTVLFFKDGVSQSQSTSTFLSTVTSTGSLPKSAWCLVDAPLDARSPVVKLKRFIVQVAPPQTQYLGWMTVVKSTEFYLAPWRLEELVVGRVVQLGPDSISVQQLSAYFTKYGSRARHAYSYAGESEGQLDLRLHPTCVSAADWPTLRVAITKAKLLRDVHAVLEPLIIIGPGQHRHNVSVSLTSRHVWVTVCSVLDFSNYRVPYEFFRNDLMTQAAASIVLKDTLEAALRTVWRVAYNLETSRRNLKEQPSEGVASLASFMCPQVDMGPSTSDSPYAEWFSVKHHLYSLDDIVSHNAQRYIESRKSLWIPLRTSRGDPFSVSLYRNYDGTHPDASVTVYHAVQSDRHVVDSEVLERWRDLQASDSGIYNLKFKFVAIILPGTTPELLFSRSLLDSIPGLELYYSFLTHVVLDG